MTQSIMSLIRRFTRIRLSAGLFCACFVLTFLMATQDAYAASSSCTLSDGTNVSINTADACPGVSATAVPFIITRAMTCIKANVAAVTSFYQCKFVTYMKPVIMGVVTLMLIIFGIKFMTHNVQSIVSESAVLVFKIGLVLLLTFQFDTLYPYFFMTIDDLLGMFGFVFKPINGCTLSGFPNINLKIGAQTFLLNNDNMKIWLQMDCIFGRIFNLPGMASGISEGYMTMLSMVFLSGNTGMMLFMLGISTAISFLILVTRSLLLVLMAYLGIGFMVILSPLAVPCLLFEQTKKYFFKWAGFIINYIIEPVFIIGFLGFFSVIIASLAMDGKYDGQQMWGGPPPAVQPLSKSLVPLPMHFHEVTFNFFEMLPDKKMFEDMLIKAGVIQSHPVCGNLGGSDCLVNALLHPLTTASNVASTVTGSALTQAYGFGRYVASTLGMSFGLYLTLQAPDISEANMMNMIVTLATMLLLFIVAGQLLWVVPEMAVGITGLAGVALFKETTRLAIAGIDLERGAANAVQAAGRAVFDANKGNGATDAIKKSLEGTASGAAEGWKSAKDSMSGVWDYKSKDGEMQNLVKGIDSVKRGGIGGMIGGGMQGGIEGLTGGIKDMLEARVKGPLRAVPDAVKGFFKGAWTGDED